MLVVLGYGFAYGLGDKSLLIKNKKGKKKFYRKYLLYIFMIYKGDNEYEGV